MRVRVALVSDTHGLSDPRLPGLFGGCARVLHAGDIVTTPVLRALAGVAEVTAVRGNNDHGPELARLPEHVLVALDGLRALMVHDLGARERPHAPVRRLLARERPEIVIHGHSHRPGAAVHEGRLFVNPGSAGPRRFSLPRTAAILDVEGRTARVTFYDLSGDGAAPYGEVVEAAL
jgi:putative phosphoesterase